MSLKRITIKEAIDMLNKQKEYFDYDAEQEKEFTENTFVAKIVVCSFCNFSSDCHHFEQEKLYPIKYFISAIGIRVHNNHMMQLWYGQEIELYLRD